MKKVLYISTLILLIISFYSSNQAKNPSVEETIAREVWTAQEANDWYVQHQWLRGSNFIPSSAINQLEMWQEDTFDAETIDRELGFAGSIGFNSMRVYLHHLDRKSTRLNSSHVRISYAVFCL